MHSETYFAIQRILDMGGTIMYRGKYMLSFTSIHPTNPDKEWEGYDIDQITDAGCHTIFRSEWMREAIIEFEEIIKQEEGGVTKE